MAFALLAVLVGVLLGGLMLPMILSQNKATRFDITRVHALHAAQAGLDIALGRIRSVATPAGLGDAAKLPCYTTASPLKGGASGTGAATYSVSVDYWSSRPTTDGTPMRCVSGYGTYDVTTHSVTPRYAVITSTGRDGTRDGGSRGRTVVSTYSFQTDDVNISGGLFRIWPDGSGNNWCMDAGSATPSADTTTPLVLEACSTTSPPLAQQVFTYRSDLSIQLVSSITAVNPNGLCVDTSSTPHASNMGMVLARCAVADVAACVKMTVCSPYNQQWSIDDNSHLASANPDQTDIDRNFCIAAPAQGAGKPLVLDGCGSGTDNPKLTWIPSPSAGAGMAGAANKQLVNYQMFATCLDVTGKQTNSSFLILYTCKQNPNPDKVAWNQRFTPVPALTSAPTNTLLQTTPGSTYCLTSPLTIGGYVRVTSPCPADSSAADGYRWTVYQTKDASGNDLKYAQKYTVVDSSGYCLGLGSSSDKSAQYYKATVSKCNGSTAQKWNANASLDAATMSNTHETVPTSP